MLLVRQEGRHLLLHLYFELGRILVVGVCLCMHGSILRMCTFIDIVCVSLLLPFQVSLH